MADIANSLVSQPRQMTGVNRLVDMVAQRLPPSAFPTSGRTFLETAQGDRSPITEKHFNSDELEALRTLITLKGGGSGSVQYKDYELLANAMRKKGQLPASMSPSLFSMGDPLGNLQTTLGRFNYELDKEGNIRVFDSYDFNPPSEGAKPNGEVTAMSGPYAWIRNYAGERIPPGMGRSVQINLSAR